MSIPGRTVLRLSDGKKGTGRKVRVGRPFWLSKQIHIHPVTGERYLKRKDGVTIRRVLDRNGTLGYCPQSEYEVIRQRELVARLENEELDKAEHDEVTRQTTP